MARVKITWSTPDAYDGDFEDFFGVTLAQYREMSQTKKDDVRLAALDTLRESMVPEINRLEFTIEEAPR